MQFQQLTLPNKVRREFFKDLSFKVVKRGEDSTEAVLAHIERLPKLHPYVPSNSTTEVPYQVNAIVNAFASVPVSYILESQFFVSFKVVTGNSAYLTIDKNIPFLAFENLPGLMIPLGKSKYRDKLLNASNIEYLFLRELLEQWSYQEHPPLTVSAQVIGERYLDWNQSKIYESDLKVAVDNGTIIEAFGRRASYVSSFKMARDFSWMVKLPLP